MQQIKKIIKWLDVNLEPLFILVLFLSMTTLITVQVILRFVFDAGLAWGEEISKFLFVWMVFFSIACAFRNNRHISVAFIRDLFPVFVRKVVVIISDILMIALMVFLLQGSVSNVIRTAEFGDMANTISLSMNFLYVSAVVGLSISLIRIVQSLVWKIKRFNASYDLFLNLRGNYSGVENTFFIPKSQRAGFVATRSEEAYEEEKQKLYKRKKQTGGTEQ